MIDKNRRSPSRIPIRFMDEDPKSERPSKAPGGEDDSELSPEEIGRGSSYDDTDEVKRRIDRGAEQDTEGGRERADDRDTAGGPRHSDLPEHREDRDTTDSSPAQNRSGAADAPGAPEKMDASRSGGSSPDATSGPLLAELLATRAELRRVESELQKATAERQELHDSFARRQADFENYRKRVERERGETYNRVVGDIASQLLPVVDNLRRALEAEASVEANESEEFRHFLHGVELIGKQLNGILENLGVEPVAAVGERFDPHVHEAVATEQTDEFQPDTVMQEIVRGYRLGDKLLRPAMVKVATK